MGGKYKKYENYIFTKGKYRLRSRAQEFLPKPPSRRKTPWATIMIRMEHYVMLKELAEFYKCSIGRAAMGLIQIEYLRQLEQVDPDKAKKLEEEYGSPFRDA